MRKPTSLLCVCVCMCACACFRLTDANRRRRTRKHQRSTTATMSPRDDAWRPCSHAVARAFTSCLSTLNLSRTSGDTCARYRLTAGAGDLLQFAARGGRRPSPVNPIKLRATLPVQSRAAVATLHAACYFTVGRVRSYAKFSAIALRPSRPVEVSC